MNLRKQFGGYIRRQRTARRMTQEELATRSELSVDAIRRIERGGNSASLRTVEKLAHALDLSLGTMFAGIEGGPNHDAHDLCDYLGGRSRREIKLAWQVLLALFDNR